MPATKHTTHIVPVTVSWGPEPDVAASSIPRKSVHYPAISNSASNYKPPIPGGLAMMYWCMLHPIAPSYRISNPFRNLEKAHPGTLGC